MSKIDTSSWKKFKISDLFTSETGDVDLQQKDVNGKGIALVSSGEANTGVIGNTDRPAKVIPADTITVDMFGNVQYRDFEYKMVTHARVFALIPKKPINREVGLYLASVLKKLTTEFSYNNMCSWNKIKNAEPLLPAVDEDVPDWDYMQERIAELEQERIAELEQYLIATGLNDYTLTDEDLKVLSLSGAGRDEAGNRPEDAGARKEMREFKMGDLFEHIPVKKAQKKDVRPAPDAEFNTPVVYAKFGDNGIMYWGRHGDFDVHANVISIVYNGAIAAGKVYAQEDETGILAESYLIRVKGADVPFLANLYMSIVIEKVIYPMYSREWLAIWNGRVETNFIQLPIQTNNAGSPVIDGDRQYHPDGYVPDWDYMAAYIRAMEKLVIKDVVDFKDAFISTAKEVAGA